MKRAPNQNAPEASQDGGQDDNPESGSNVVELVNPIVQNDEQTKESAESGAALAASGQEEQIEHGSPPNSDDPEAPFGRRVDGTPAKKRGRRPASVSDESDKQRQKLRSVTGSTPRAKPAPPQLGAPVLAVVNYQAMGQTVADLWFNAGTVILGDEWKPNIQEGEHLAVAGAFTSYFRSVQMRDLPPLFALCFVLGTYTLKRAAQPTIRTKLQRAGLWFKENLKIPRIRLGGGN
jgi:hypothetical protein